jgi:predicted acylesterase/phospholipase RssA
MTSPLSAAELEAQAIVIDGAAVSPARALELDAVLRSGRRFGLARKLLARAAADPGLAQQPALRRAIARKRCLSTYKDPDLAAAARLDEAWRILSEVEDLASTTDTETLGLAGSIEKARWALGSRQRHLTAALAYYHRGYLQGVATDGGYTAINAAFMLDLLAALDIGSGGPADDVSGSARLRLAQAREIRSEIVRVLPTAGLKEDWWFLATLGEACIGLGDFQAARPWLKRAAALPGVPDWEHEATARQLVALLRAMAQTGRLEGPDARAQARQALHDLLGSNAAAVDSVVRGKVGLGLSGGGFRASFYHVGLLARLAELDLLRHVEYLSCVSGGSIVGAHYYLEVRKLLSEKRDTDIVRQDYIDIVARIERDFFEGVGSNIRSRIGAEWLTNLKMIFVPSYSRTLRVGALYESEIYAKVKDADGIAGKERWIDELKIQPLGEVDDFSPRQHNWRRQNKVPVLVLNATCLNTGHNWQFTASWMGEPPAGIDAEVDANFRLRRMYYSDAPEGHQRVRLGHAVAASACVPGIFEPLTLPDLYERTVQPGDKKVRPLVRLVDGGVHDNQGVSSLLEQGCTVMLISDASGQMENQDTPSSSLIGVPLRTSSILQSRVRASQYQDLASRRDGSLLSGFMFIHLKKGLEGRPVDWIGSTDRTPPGDTDPLLPYGVQRIVQTKLAGVRTDLDSFSEVEANALMATGYLTTAHALSEPILGFEVPQQPRAAWGFLAIEPLLRDPAADSPLLRQLSVASQVFFKIWLLTRRLQLLAGVVAVVALAVAGYLAYAHWVDPIATVTVQTLALAGLTAVLSLLGLTGIARVVDYRKTAADILIGVGMASFGFLLARLHLHVFDKMFLRQGRLSKFVPTGKSSRK